MPQELAPLADAMNQLSDRMADAYRATSRSLEEQRRLRASLEQVVDAREREIAQRTAELRNAVAELDRLSRTDALTGCLNYRGFREVATSCGATRTGRAACCRRSRSISTTSRPTTTATAIRAATTR